MTADCFVKVLLEQARLEKLQQGKKLVQLGNALVQLAHRPQLHQPNPVLEITVVLIELSSKVLTVHMTTTNILHVSLMM